MIEFTSHAKRKIRQRNLKQAWIRQTLKSPDYVFPSFGGREIAYKKIGKLYLAVIFIKENKNLVVLTSHWEEGFKPRKEKKR